MKKLLSVFAAAAMLFGFASCSGDLHDFEVPAENVGGAVEGFWYYISAGTPDGAPTLIFNGNSLQTPNIANTKATGNVFYKIDDTKEIEYVDFGETKKGMYYEEITEDDAKALGWVDKKLAGLGIYCFAPKSFDPDTVGLNLYGHTPECLGGWPGSKMLCDASSADPSKYEITFIITVDMKNTDYEEGKEIFVNGAAYGWNTWPYSGWGGNKEDASKDQFGKIVNGKVNYTVKTTIESIGVPTEYKGAFCVTYPNADCSNVNWQSVDIDLSSFSTTAYSGMMKDFKNAGYAAKLEYPILISTDGTKDDKGKYKFTAVVQ